MTRPFAFLIALLAALPACAEEPPPPKDPSALELLGEAGGKMLQAIDKLVAEMPQYEMPEVNERGDIIIRRKNPKNDEPVRTRQRPDEDRT